MQCQIIELNIKISNSLKTRSVVGKLIKANINISTKDQMPYTLIAKYKNTKAVKFKLEK